MSKDPVAVRNGKRGGRPRGAGRGAPNLYAQIAEMTGLRVATVRQYAAGRERRFDPDSLRSVMDFVARHQRR